jgi:gluconolactonase
MTRLASTSAHEGPVYVADEDALYFTTVPSPAVAVRRLDLSGGVTTVREDANMANGMALAPDGRLVVCEQGTMTSRAAIALVDRRTGAREVLVDAFLGLPLNSPNDVLVASDGAVWFTDPSYGHLQGFRPSPELPDQVYRHDPRTGATSVVADGFDKPNGLALSPDESTLYVGDSEEDVLWAFDLRRGGRRRFADVSPGHPDGLKTDPDGRVLVTFAGGIRVYDPDGTVTGGVDLPGAVNFTFGPGALLVCADDAIWAAPVP